MEMPDTTVSRSRRATRSTADSSRLEALERLKAIRRSGSRRSESGSAIQVKLEEPIYETLAEEEYLALKAKRQEDAKGFIVDDDGLGYAEEGQEEDWAISALPPSSDEDGFGSDGEERHRRKKKREAKKESATVPGPKKHAPTSLSAAAALMGKQRLSAMFTSSTFKKHDRVKGSESIVDDLIAEFAPDETDREERRRKRGPPVVTHYVAPVQHTVGPPVVSIYKNEIPCALDEPQVEIDTSPVDVGREMDVVGNGVASQIDNACTGVKEENSREPELKTNSNSNDIAEMQNVNGVAVEPVLKVEKVSSFNAKRKVEKDEKLMSATAGWKAVCKGDVGSPNIEEQAVANTKLDEDLEFALNSDGTLPFYLIDIHEESYGSNEGTLYLFGKVKVATAYQSCCVIVKNMQRCIYAIPKGSIFQNSEITDLEKSVANSQIAATAFRTKLQEMSSGIKSEIAKTLVGHNVSCFSMMPVKRGYAFERNDIPRGEKYVLKINYPFKDPPLPSDLKGDLFNAILGTNRSALELFIVKRKIKGPSWLSVSKFAISSAHERVSWCKFEIVVDLPKDISLSTAKTVLEIPPVIVTAINLKTIVSEKHHGNEVVSASAICCHKAKIDGPMLASDLKRSGVLSSFTILRKLEGGIFPMGFMKNVTDRNLKDGTNILLVESSERALLNRFMIELHKMDTDVLVGHNISGFDLDVLLHRAQVCKLPSSMWSKIGRLKRSIMPKLTKGATLYGSGASPGIMSCIAGRLLCDTYLCSRDLLREVSYSLTELARTQLNKNREEIAPNDIPAKFNSSESLLQLVDCGETDAWLSLELMFHLSILPLTRQLTNISGNLWGKTLQGARAQRVEYLLLHSFHAKKYMVPDKNISKSKAFSTTKRRLVGADVENGNDVHNGDDDSERVEHVKGKKGPAYAGGLVLEPKKGLYDKFVLLLDFNSLYPSIIQEYNICFTTVERSLENSTPNLPSSTTTGVLPELLRNLVERRRMVKSWLKTASGLKVQQLDIQQQALKLTANSIYGCLGFSNSRFYAKPIAELITSQGREILQNTVDLVQNLLNLEVIYGDTDSIMIYSGLDDIDKARAMAAKVIQEVNKKYRCLEIDLDGLYKRMLLLKKKKYAAVKVQIKDGKPYEVIERKGLDIVRRDWSLLAKEAGEMCLRQILSGGSCDDVVEMIHDYLLKVQDDVRNGEVELEKYVIRKTLTKSPEEYPDGRNQPHVQVALRLKQSGYSSGWSAGDTISYVICCEQGISSSGGIAERARHPDELKDITNCIVDIDYYLSQQIHPVVSRLCAFIQGTSPARLADCLGLDSSKFQHKTTESTSSDPSRVLAVALDESERYLGCEPLRLTCPSCSCSFDCPPISTLLSTSSNLIDPEMEKESGKNFWRKMCCPRCPGDADGAKISSAMISNQVKRQAESFVSIYYKGLMICDDELCKYATRIPNLRVVGDSVRGTVCPNYPQCNGRLIKKFTEAEVYRQLTYFCHIFDSKHHLEKLDNSARTLFGKELTRVYPTINLAFMTIKKIRDRCAFGWVQLEDLSVTV